MGGLLILHKASLLQSSSQEQRFAHFNASAVIQCRYRQCDQAFARLSERYIALVLVVLALLFWQLIEQFHQTQERQRQRSLEYSIQLSDRMSLNMALKAQIAMNLLDEAQSSGGRLEQPTALASLRTALPALRSAARLNPTGDIVGDSAEASRDGEFLRQAMKKAQGHPYFYTGTEDVKQIYILIRQGGGVSGDYWALRMAPDALKDLASQPAQDFQHI